MTTTSAVRTDDSRAVDGAAGGAGPLDHAPPVQPALEAVPVSIGIAVAGGGVHPILEAGLPLPAESRQTLSTSRAGQSRLRLVLYLGDSERAAECVRVGELLIGDLRDAEAGEVDVELSVKLETAGRLTVCAREPDSGRESCKEIDLVAAVWPSLGEPVRDTSLPAPPPGDPEDSAIARKLRDRVDRLDRQSFYEMLDLPAHAGTAEVKVAFLKAGLEFHPDRLDASASSATRARARILFRRLAEAFRVLTDPERRRQYDAALARGEACAALPPPPASKRPPKRPDEEPRDPALAARTPEGRKHLRLGLEAAENGDLEMAFVQVRFACRCEPGNTEIEQVLSDIDGERLLAQIEIAPDAKCNGRSSKAPRR